jgi:hypothetical protein
MLRFACIKNRTGPSVARTLLCAIPLVSIERMSGTLSVQQSDDDFGEKAGAQNVTPWDVDVEGGVDYDKLMREFGAQPIDAAMIARIERLTKKPAHVFLRRGLFYTHR